MTESTVKVALHEQVEGGLVVVGPTPAMVGGSSPLRWAYFDSRQ